MDARIRALDSRWAPAGLAWPVRALVLTGAGFVLPVLAVFCLVWSGLLTAAPDCAGRPLSCSRTAVTE